MPKPKRVRGRRGKRPESEWQKALPALSCLSSHMRQFARSPRGFDVGVAAIAWGKEQHPIVLGGANHKKYAGLRRHRNGDYCGEMEIITAAKAQHCDEILGMIVTAPLQEDDMSSRDFGVTVSCYFCRVDFRRERRKRNSPLRGHTRLRFNHPTDPNKFFERTVDELLALFPNDPPYTPAAGQK